MAVRERVIYDEKRGDTWHTLIEQVCDCYGEKKIIEKTYTPKSDRELEAEAMYGDHP